MSMQGNMAVEAELKRLLEVMDKHKNDPPEKQIEALRAEIESTLATAKSGWL